MFVYCVHPLRLVCVWEQQILNETLQPTRPLLALCCTSTIQKAFITEQAEDKQGEQPLMSLNSEVQTLGEIQTFFTFPNTEIKGLCTGFYLINKRSKQNILEALCVQWSLSDHWENHYTTNMNRSEWITTKSDIFTERWDLTLHSFNHNNDVNMARFPYSFRKHHLWFIPIEIFTPLYNPD